MVVVVLVCPSDLDDGTEVDLRRGSACVGVAIFLPEGSRVRTGFGNWLAECCCRRCENSNPRKHQPRGELAVVFLDRELSDHRPTR